MKTVKILRKDYLSLTQTALATYAENIIKRCDGNPDYSAFQALISELKPLTLSYNEALIVARNRGTDNVAVKNALRTKVLDAIEKIVVLMEALVTDQTLIVNAGLKPAEGRQYFRGELQMPTALELKPSGAGGEIQVRFKLPKPALVRANALEYSTDQGETWKNGAYQTRSKMLVSGLPSGQMIMVRVRSIGTGGAVSPWTAPVSQFVI